jgi:hypothetical protein
MIFLFLNLINPLPPIPLSSQNLIYANIRRTFTPLWRRRRNFDRHQTIFNEGEKPKYYYQVVEGRIN